MLSSKLYWGMFAKDLVIFVSDRSQAGVMLVCKELCHFKVGPGSNCGKLANNLVIFRQTLILGSRCL